MEKFYTVNEGSSLHKAYWDWVNHFDSNKKISEDFLKEFGIEATSYCPDVTVLGIVPTENDKIRFLKQLCSKDTDGGLRFFKKNSVVNREWVKRAARLKSVHKPLPAWYNKYSGRSSSRLFDHNGILYCSFSAERIEMPTDTFTEIKGSEFYRIMEEIEQTPDTCS